MKKFIIILGFIFTSFMTYSLNSEVTLGVGYGVIESPYVGVDYRTSPVPLFRVIYGPLAIVGGEVLLSTRLGKETGLAGSLFYTPLGGHSVDGKDLAEGYDKIDDKDIQNEYGLRLSYKPPLYEDIAIRTRVAFGDEGNVYSLRGDKTFDYNDKLDFIAGIFGNYYDSSYTGYYYGVSDKDVMNNSKLSSKYDPGSGLTYGIDLGLEYEFVENFYVVLGGRVEALSSEIKDSPIVDESVLLGGSLGVRYKF